MTPNERKLLEALTDAVIGILGGFNAYETAAMKNLIAADKAVINERSEISENTENKE